MSYLSTIFGFHLSTILLATSPLLTGLVLVVILAVVGVGLWYFNQQKQLKAIRQKAVNTLKQLQHQLAGLNEALTYLNKYPSIINIEDNIHASDVSQVISEYLNFTEANILGDPSIGKAPMTKQEAQEFISRIKNNLSTITPIAQNNQLLVEGIKMLDVLEEKKTTYAQQLPHIKQRIEALIASNTDWWHAQNSFTSYADLGQLHIELGNGISKGWEFLKQSGSTESEAQGIQQINQALDKTCLQIDQIMFEVGQLETHIGNYQNRLQQDPLNIQQLADEINEWQAQYTYINKQLTIKQAHKQVQQAQQLAQATKKDWASIVKYLDQALAAVQQAKDYFVRFNKAHQHYEHTLSHTIAAQQQSIEQWTQQADYAHLPKLDQHTQSIQIAQSGLDSLLAKAPTVDWLMVEETAQELTTQQAQLLDAFEAYKAAHQQFLQLINEINHLHQAIDPLEQTVRMKIHAMLPRIDQKQVALERAQGWFEKTDAATSLVNELQAYVNDLKEKEALMYKTADQANDALAEAQALLNNPQITPEHRDLIEDLRVPPMAGVEFGQLMMAFDQALREIIGVQTRIRQDLMQQATEQQQLAHLTSECQQAIDRVQALQSKTGATLSEAICQLEMPDIDHYTHDEAMDELELTRRKAADLYNQAQTFIIQQGD
jgi:chromosome segregation ATPase